MMVITKPTDLSPLNAPLQLGKIAQIVDEDAVAPYLVIEMWTPALKPEKHANLNYFGSYVVGAKPREADRKNVRFNQTQDTSPSPILSQPRTRAGPPGLGPRAPAPGTGAQGEQNGTCGWRAGGWVVCVGCGRGGTWLALCVWGFVGWAGGGNRGADGMGAPAADMRPQKTYF